MLRRFIRANERICDRISPRLPQFRPNIGARFEEVVVQHMNSSPRLLIVDVGSGRHCPFAEYKDSAMQPRVVGVDISEEDLRQNRTIDDYRVADVTQGLPFADAEVDMLVSLNTLEHISPLPAFVKHAHRVLKPGGLFIHMFASRYAPYVLVNRLLPHSVARRLLHFLYEESRDRAGYPAYYDHCSARGIESLLRANGFEIESLEVGYYQSAYYRFFVPFYLLSAGYELLIRAFGLRSLAANVFVIARKKID
jgi:SAM-dependent methyltransferase